MKESECIIVRRSGAENRKPSLQHVQKNWTLSAQKSIRISISEKEKAKVKEKMVSKGSIE
jgi:hypothetical protein